ncbi:hypothetical protein AAFF_G00328780 [Aldrovandia affinis]|uniref:Uncharacterized protein n=1 Tax=Aldrovandia affinis TaxID=143900 RepID=A0AAD7SLP0_9TELE|nr:hypothetical protein AAFF_G00328780 [Aldrovandia affinis]
MPLAWNPSCWFHSINMKKG